ncbi:MAG: hypothetical protein CMK43_02200 [Porticoccaceae bacterium]|nr:hypothetical protein [Porticoccaceae bacterium]|tara:strand:- start:88 stop:687 length:600 start_codon:yes stop_codon:yes gene_type:complete
MGIRITFIFVFLSFGIDARPISYSGGSTIMAFSDNMKNSIYVHYSPTYKYSIGVEKIRDKYFNEDYLSARFTYLIDRENTKFSQRNLYFQSGLSSKGFNNYFYGMHGDWETRRLFVGFGLKKTEKKIQDYLEQSYQIGVAPYLGDYGDLHTWVMLKSKKNSLDNKWSTYPVLKFFKGNTLMEIGYHRRTNLDFHVMYRF